nr:hypothetical protein GCM10017745_82940 [Saccharothrix mutabilis subsp. capreolus]
MNALTRSKAKEPRRRAGPRGWKGVGLSPYGLPEATTLWSSPQPEKLVAEKTKARLGCAQAVRGQTEALPLGLGAHQKRGWARRAGRREARGACFGVSRVPS